jgi:hypothetical protein
MFKKKIGGLLIILLMVSLSIGSAYSSNEYDQSPEGKVDSIEQSLRETNIGDFQNSSYYNNLSADKKNIFTYFYNKTGGDLAITTEVFGQASKIWSADDINFYGQYINGNASVRESISNNTILNQRLGYLHKYVSDWQHLSKQEKVQFFNTDKHDTADALALLNRVDNKELLYINGAMINDKQANKTGYNALGDAFTRLSKVSPNDVNDKDMKTFEDGCERFTESVFNYHYDYVLLKSADKANVWSVLNSTFKSNPGQVNVLNQLKDFYNGIDDIADVAYKLGTSGVISGGVGTGFGTAFTVAGVVLIVLGAILLNPTLAFSGLGLLTTGLFFIGMSTPHLPASINIRNLGSKMQDFVKEVKPIIATMIAGIEAGV